ncbi:Ketimine reductase mu-crystallin [Vanrija pseudolonga]|uniref:Ketimine reductase mu-crystallin n=1 Tax=Vanrija pseudolonga TaxID=143232 RepID=A0AAF1BQD8_9TREE|nr:Ketimine reductase mu-crystallin [Vanrija pseudolonga]
MSESLTIMTRAQADAVLADLDLEAAIKGQADVFAAYSAGGTKPGADGIAPIQTPMRHVLASPDVNMLFMPARAVDKTSIKIVSVPKRGGDGLPGSTVILDEVSGRVRAIINARRLTAFRNAAGSVLSFRAIGKTQTPRRLVLFGAGGQADAHALFFARAYPSLKELVVVSRKSTPRSTALVAKLTKLFPAVAVSEGIASYPDTSFDLSAAIKGADIIVTMTSSTKALFAAADVKAGAHIVLVGSYKPEMREVEDELIQRAGTILVDSAEACGHEAGELQNVAEDKLVEIGAVVTGTAEAKALLSRFTSDVTIFKSVGLGVQDVAIASLVLDQAEAKGLVSKIDDYDAEGEE